MSLRKAASWTVWGVLAWIVMGAAAMAAGWFGALALAFLRAVTDGATP
jgi:hypothetical protein